MPFYRKQLTYEEIAPYAQKMLLWLRQNCPVVREYDEDYELEAFLLDAETARTTWVQHRNVFSVLQQRNWADFIPFTTDRSVGMLLFYPEVNGPKQSVSPTHIKLPKLSHLITLTPDDFFALFRILDTAKNTQTGNSLMLNPAAAGVQNLLTSPLYPFFTKLRVNYRMCEEYMGNKWTRRSDIKFIAGLEPTRDNQFSAMQYLTARQNKDLMYFPVDTVVQLELDCQQLTDDYCVPPEGGNFQ